MLSKLRVPTRNILVLCCVEQPTGRDCGEHLNLVDVFSKIVGMIGFQAWEFWLGLGMFFVLLRQKGNKVKRNIQFHANLKNLDSGGIESLKFYTDVSKAQVI